MQTLATLRLGTPPTPDSLMPADECTLIFLDWIG
jgi:hypothetical protein